MDQAIVANLESAPYQIELYSEDLEATLFPDEASSANSESGISISIATADQT